MFSFNLNIEIVAPECLIPNLSYTYKFAFIMTLPLAIAAVFALAYAWLVVWKRCLRGIRDRRKVYSPEPFLVSSCLVLLYIMYLYLTRTVMDIFDCTPTTPPDSRSDASAPSATPTEKAVSSTVSTPSLAPRPSRT